MAVFIFVGRYECKNNGSQRPIRIQACPAYDCRTCFACAVYTVVRVNEARVPVAGAQYRLCILVFMVYIWQIRIDTTSWWAAVWALAIAWDLADIRLSAHFKLSEAVSST